MGKTLVCLIHLLKAAHGAEYFGENDDDGVTVLGLSTIIYKI